MATKSSQLLAAIEVLKEALKLPSRNKKTFLFVILSTLILNSLLLIANLASLIPFIPDDFSGDRFNFTSMDLFLVILVETLFLLLIARVSLLSMVFTIYLSSISYLGRDITVKELCMNVKKISIRPLITWFYIFLFICSFGFITCTFGFLVPLAGSSTIQGTVGIFLVLIGCSFNLYHSLLAQMSLVVSVLESCLGFEPFRRAARLIKGKKVVVLLPTFIPMLLFYAVSIVSLVNTEIHQKVMLLIVFVAFNLYMLMIILNMMVQTVFYFKFKQSLGEFELEIEDEIGYQELSTVAPTVASDLP